MISNQVPNGVQASSADMHLEALPPEFIGFEYVCNGSLFHFYLKLCKS
jgi:hypothetical protein